MIFDLVMPTVIFLILLLSVLAYQKASSSIETQFEKKKISIREVVLMVVSMGIMVTIMAFVPRQAIQIGFIAIFSYSLFTFSYVAIKKWYLALLPPIAFLGFYFFYWELIVFNIFAATFAIVIIIYLSSLFTWKTVRIFAILLTVMDIIQVFGTGYMGQYANKMIELRLPVLLLLQTYPAGSLIGLGLGDIFLAGLLTIQTASKYGKKSGILTSLSIGIAMFLFEVALLNTGFARYFPATLVVVAGWIGGLGITLLDPELRNSQSLKEKETFLEKS